jgi:hypothetical protein
VLDQLTVDDFTPAVGQRFVIAFDDIGKIELELTEAQTHERDAPARDDAGTRSPFSAVFRGPADPILPQRVYRVEHDSLGPLEIFIVPIGRDASGTAYEAVFS